MHLQHTTNIISHKKRSRHNLLSQNTCWPFFTLYFMVCWLKFGGIQDRRTSFEKFTRNVVSGSGPTPSMMTHLTNQTLALVRWSLSGALSRPQTLWCHVKSRQIIVFRQGYASSSLFVVFFSMKCICSFLLSAWLHFGFLLNRLPKCPPVYVSLSCPQKSKNLFWRKAMLPGNPASPQPVSVFFLITNDQSCPFC